MVLAAMVLATAGLERITAAEPRLMKLISSREARTSCEKLTRLEFGTVHQRSVFRAR